MYTLHNLDMPRVRHGQTISYKNLSCILLANYKFCAIFLGYKRHIFIYRSIFMNKIIPGDSAKN